MQKSSDFNPPFMIGVSGGSGSGKTCFMEDLRTSFSERDLCMISLDEYYRPRDTQAEDPNGIVNFDLPSCIDIDRFMIDLQALMSGEQVHKEEYVFNNPNAEPRIKTYTPASIIMVEGLYIYYFRVLAELFNLKLFIHAKETSKIIRRIKRDQRVRNYPLEDVLYRYEFHVTPSFEQHVKPYMDECDIIINNHAGYKQGLKVIEAFIKAKIESQ